MAKLTALGRFKVAARAGDKSANRDAMVRKDYFAPAESLGGRCLRFTISTSTPDRDNDVVNVNGWELANFRRNPVVLFAHKSDEMPIGKVVDLTIEGGALKASVEFVPANLPCIGEKAEAVYQLLLGGFLNATSVGFQPLDYDLATDEARGDEGIDFLRQELLELSIVPVPANPEALIDPGQRGLPNGTSGDPRTEADPATDMIPEPTMQLSADATAAIEKAVTSAIEKAGTTGKPVIAERGKSALKLRVKGMWQVGELAATLNDLGWIQGDAAWEAEFEQDGSKVPAMLGEAMQAVGAALIAMTAEETAELLAAAMPAAAEPGEAAVAGTDSVVVEDAVEPVAEAPADTVELAAASAVEKFRAGWRKSAAIAASKAAAPPAAVVQAPAAPSKSIDAAAIRARRARAVAAASILPL